VLGLDLSPTLTLTRRRGLATVSCRLGAAPYLVGILQLSCVTSLLMTVPLELTFHTCGGLLSLVAGLRAQHFPDKTAQLPRDSHHCFVALESARQKTRIATMQPVLRSPTDGPHLIGLALLTPAQLLAYFRRASVMLRALDQ